MATRPTDEKFRELVRDRLVREGEVIALRLDRESRERAAKRRVRRHYEAQAAEARREGPWA